MEELRGGGVSPLVKVLNEAESDPSLTCVDWSPSLLLLLGVSPSTPQQSVVPWKGRNPPCSYSWDRLTQGTLERVPCSGQGLYGIVPCNTKPSGLRTVINPSFEVKN